MAIAADKPQKPKEWSADELLELANSFPTQKQQEALVAEAERVGRMEGRGTYRSGAEKREVALDKKIAKMETATGPKEFRRPRTPGSLGKGRDMTANGRSRRGSTTGNRGISPAESGNRATRTTEPAEPLYPIGTCGSMMGDHRVRVNDDDYDELVRLMKESDSDLCPADTVSRLILVTSDARAKRKA